MLRSHIQLCTLGGSGVPCHKPRLADTAVLVRSLRYSDRLGSLQPPSVAGSARVVMSCPPRCEEGRHSWTPVPAVPRCSVSCSCQSCSGQCVYAACACCMCMLLVAGGSWPGCSGRYNAQTRMCPQGKLFSPPVFMLIQLVIGAQAMARGRRSPAPRPHLSGPAGCTACMCPFTSTPECAFPMPGAGQQPWGARGRVPA